MGYAGVLRLKDYCMLTNVYIDGFNLYHRALRREARFKWLDLAKLCQTLLPAHEIKRIRYFTAIVHMRPEDPQQQMRQQIYLCAANHTQLGYTLRAVQEPCYAAAARRSRSGP